MLQLIIILLVLSLVYWLIVTYLPVPQPFKNVILILLVLVMIWKLLQFAGLV